MRTKSTLTRALLRAGWIPCLAVAPMVACSAAPQGATDGPVAKTTSALDPNQVIPPTSYTITLQQIYVNEAEEPWQSGAVVENSSGIFVPIPTTPACGAIFTPDTGYVDWAQLGVKINPGSAGEIAFNDSNPQTTACVLGPAGTGATLSACTGGAYNNGVYQQGEPLSINFYVSARDQVSFALAVDNVENAQVDAIPASNLSQGLSNGFKIAGDSGQLLGALIGVAGGVTLNPALGVDGAIMAGLGNGSALTSDLLPSNGVDACTATEVAEMATSCVGGLMGNPPGNPPTNPFCDAPNQYLCSYAGVTPDTLFIVDPNTQQPLTAEALQSMTAEGPATLVFNPIIADPLGAAHFFSPSVPRPMPAPQHMYGCGSNLEITIQIARKWTDGPASFAKSADMAVVRSPGTIDTFASSPSSYENQLVHDWGQGTGFSSEVEAPAQALEESGVTLSTNPAVISRTEANLDMFYVDANGGFYNVSQAAPTYAWSTTTLGAPTKCPIVRVGAAARGEVVPEVGCVDSVAPPNALVTGAARTPDNLDMFFIGRDGNVYTTYWSTTAPTWGGLYAATEGYCTNTTTACAGSASPGGGVAADSRVPTGLDVFYIGTDGGLWTSYWNQGYPWTTQEIYGPHSEVQNGPAIAPPGAVITATARTTGNIDVFFIGTDGGVWQASWVEGNNHWGTSEMAHSSGTGLPGGPISAVARQAQAIDVVYQGAGDTLQWATWAAPATLFTVASIPAAGYVATTPLGRGGVSIVAPTAYSLQAFYLNALHQENTVSWADVNECNTVEGIACTPSTSTWSGEMTLPQP